MVFDITQIKKIRKQMGMTQHAFAREIGISQSMIAKLEAGRLDPTYSKVKQIEEGLLRMMKKDEKSAREIMTKKIISVSIREKVRSIIDMMRKNDVSQVPVIERGNVIGMVSETSILSKNLEDIGKATAQDVMIDSPPIIAPDTRMEVMKQLLNYYSLLLVKEKGKLIGLITRSDLMKSMV